MDSLSVAVILLLSVNVPKLFGFCDMSGLVNVERSEAPETPPP